MSKRLRIYTAAGVVFLGLVLFFGIGIHALLYSPEIEITPPSALAATAASPSAYPLRVEIPQIGVNAVIQPRGLIAGNRMAAPTNFTDVGWYEYGTVPGNIGTAVLYAHLDNGLGLDGVFKNLNQLSLGSEIDIITASGTPERYVVDDIETYPYQAVPPRALGEAPSDGKAHITLITCAGNPVNDPKEGFTYDHRLVVYATLAP